MSGRHQRVTDAWTGMGIVSRVRCQGYSDMYGAGSAVSCTAPAVQARVVPLVLSYWYIGPVTDASSCLFPPCFLSHRVLHHLQARAARQARYWCHPLFPLHPPQVENREPCLYGPARCDAPMVCVEVKVVFLLPIVALLRGCPVRRQEGIARVALGAPTGLCHSLYRRPPWLPCCVVLSALGRC